MMASATANAAVPQPGPPLPANLTPQLVKEYYAKYQQMKAQGAGEDNAEYVKLHGILRAVQQQSEMQKQRQQFSQQQQQMRRQQQQLGPQAPHQNGAANPEPVNGANASAPTNAAAAAPPASGPKSAVAAAVPPASGPTGDAVAAAAKPAATTQASSFTAEQLSLLKNQILAFKLLSKNLAIPPNVQQQLFANQSRRPASVASTSTAGPASESPAPAPGPNAAAVTPSQPAPATQPQPEAGRATAADDAAASVRGPRTFTSPYAHLKPRLSYAEHGSRERRLMIPSIMPTGVDLDRLRDERERLLYNRIVARRAELEQLPASLAGWRAAKADRAGPLPDDGLKLKALLELKMLGLLPKQRALRQQLSRDLVQNDSLAMTANRAMYRRMKKQSLREARITEKLEKQQRDARENREKKKHVDYLQSILGHGRDIHLAAANQRARVQKLGRMVLQHHQQIEKEEQKRIERTAKQRLQALKSNDEEAYLKLLDQAKDTRITHLLKQTDGFLNQLAASVKHQQRSAVERYGGEYVDDEPDDDEDDDDDDAVDGDGQSRAAKIDYYQVAHRIREEVKAQPDILVGGTLKEYQLKGLQWMISLYNNNLNGILADEMGLGKTIQTISLITYLIEKKKQKGPFLVIVPLSTLTNWNLEFEKWAPSVNRIVYKGPPTVRKGLQQNIRWGNFHVLLTTYEFIIKDRPVLSKIKWVHMIVDEGHRMKNAQSKLSSTLTQYYTTRYRLILTGTPLQNNLVELWAMLNFVLPNIFKSVKSFDEWFNTPFANTGGQDRMELTEEEQLLVIRRLHKVLRPFLLRRLKTDVEKDLPEKQERVIKCVFSALQAKLYKQMMTDQKIMVTDGKGGKTGIRGLSNMLMQLRKLCNHPFVFTEVEDVINPSRSVDDSIWRTAGKFELLDRVLPKFKASGHRVLMFFQMTAIMNIMEDYMRMRGFNHLRLDGTTKSDDRSELLRLFNAPDSPYFIFLLSTRAGGLGLNLQTADTVIIFDSDWNPFQDLQAQDRAHRIGQKNEVRILRLISSNSVEEKILERAQYKLDMDGKVIQAGKFDNKSTAEERDQLLRTLMESAEATESLDQEEMDDDDLNLIMARSEAELELFRRLDAERNAESAYGPGKPLPRLLTEAELPEIYLSENTREVEEVEEVAGRGARQRTQVKYDDGLTEEQWLDAVDADDDTIEDAVARKQARIAKRQANKEKRARGEAVASPAPSRDESEPAAAAAATPVPKKRGRKQGAAEKRKAEEAPDEAGPPPAKRKRGRASKTASDALGPDERALHQTIFQNVYQGLMALEAAESEEDEAGEKLEKRSIIGPFVKLPPKAVYADYYLIIPSPIAMDQIKKKIAREEYGSIKDFLDDVRLMCNNARTYNEDGSALFQDANTIEAAALSMLREETEDHPELAGFDEPGSSAGDGRSTAPISGAGTPLTSASASVPGKLKLTFNNAHQGQVNGSRADDDDDEDDDG